MDPAESLRLQPVASGRASSRGPRGQIGQRGHVELPPGPMGGSDERQVARIGWPVGRRAHRETSCFSSSRRPGDGSARQLGSAADGGGSRFQDVEDPRVAPDLEGAGQLLRRRKCRPAERQPARRARPAGPARYGPGEERGSGHRQPDVCGLHDPGAGRQAARDHAARRDIERKDVRHHAGRPHGLVRILRAPGPPGLRARPGRPRAVGLRSAGLQRRSLGQGRQDIATQHPAPWATTMGRGRTSASALRPACRFRTTSFPSRLRPSFRSRASPT